MSVVEKRGPLKYYSPTKKNILGRFCVLKGMKFLLWDSDKAFNQGKKPDEIVLNYRTQVQPLGKKMGKAFCIHILTNGANEALWAKDVDDQNSWIEAIERACKKPEETVVVPVAQSNSNNSMSDIKIQVAIPGSAPGGDPNYAYQQAMMQQQQQQQQQQMQLQYQQQLAAYNQMLLMQQQQQPQFVAQQQFNSSSGSIPMQQYNSFSAPPPPVYAGGLTGAPVVYAPQVQVPDNFYSHASPAVSPAPSPVLSRHNSPKPLLNSVPTAANESPYGRF